MFQSKPRFAPLSLLAVAMLSLAACKQESAQPTEIADVREVQRLDTPASPSVSDAERLGFRNPGATPAGAAPNAPFASGAAGPMGAGGAMGGADMAAPFDVSYELPAGWTELAPKQFRKPNLLIAGNPDAECYITILPGTGGGPLLNVNRWLGQLAQPPLTEDQLAELPRAEILGAQAYVVMASGDFTGMGIETRPNFGLIGRVLEVEGHAVFIKATGPSDVIAAEAENFAKFAASLKIVPGSQPVAPSAPPLDPGATLPAGHPPLEVTPEPAAARPTPPKLAWTAPAGWTEKPSSSMRAVTLGFGGNPANECYVIVLPGDAGGAEANLNRWRAQLGLAPVSALELAELPAIPVLGKQCPLIEGQGKYTGMSGPPLEDAALLGTVCELGSHSVFIKLTGAAADVTAQRAAFEAFCASLKVAP